MEARCSRIRRCDARGGDGAGRSVQYSAGVLDSAAGQRGRVRALETVSTLHGLRWVSAFWVCRRSAAAVGGTNAGNDSSRCGAIVEVPASAACSSNPSALRRSRGAAKSAAAYPHRVRRGFGFWADRELSDAAAIQSSRSPNIPPGGSSRSGSTGHLRRTGIRLQVAEHTDGERVDRAVRPRVDGGFALSLGAGKATPWKFFRVLLELGEEADGSGLAGGPGEHRVRTGAIRRPAGGELGNADPRFCAVQPGGEHHVRSGDGDPRDFAGVLLARGGVGARGSGK